MAKKAAKKGGSRKDTRQPGVNHPAKHDRPGRRPFFEDEITRQAVIDNASLGAPEKDAAEAAGIHPDTLERALNIGEITSDDPNDADAGYRRFFTDYKRARARGKVANLGVVRQAARGHEQRCSDKTCRQPLPSVIPYKAPCGHLNQIRTYLPPEWTAAAWSLERGDPENFGRRSRVEITQYVSRDQLNNYIREMFECVAQFVPDRATLIAIWEAWAQQFPLAPDQTASTDGALLGRPLMLPSKRRTTINEEDAEILDIEP